MVDEEGSVSVYRGIEHATVNSCIHSLMIFFSFTNNTFICKEQLLSLVLLLTVISD